MHGKKMVGPVLQGKWGGHFRIGPTGSKIYERVRSYPKGLVEHAASGHGLKGSDHEMHFAELTARVKAAHTGRMAGEHARLAAFHDRRFEQHKKAGNAPLAAAHAKLWMVHNDLARRDPVGEHLKKAGL